MNLTHTCLECLYRQIENFLHTLQSPLSDTAPSQAEILSQTKCIINSLPTIGGDCIDADSIDTDSALPPPKAAIAIYENLAKALNEPDPYKHIKTHSIESAARFLTNATIPTSTLSDCIKVAALGNVIDYGSQSRFSFEFDFDFAQLSFARFDIEAFEGGLENAKSLLYIADNAGENLFDVVLLRHLRAHYPSLSIVYLVRGKPIINDLTMEDLAHPLCAEIHTLCDVRSSHLTSPGFIYTDAPADVRALFDNANIIVAKGMGNYECLESLKRANLFLLFKVKCSVVAQYSGFGLGKMVFLHNKGGENA